MSRSHWRRSRRKIATRGPAFRRTARCASSPDAIRSSRNSPSAMPQRFIPNDLYFHPDTEFIAVITGPNMGGKSTYLRQAALLVILAQMGSFVPAESALLPIVDRVFTRIGAADNLARGRSTFMVEMTETAVILNTATARSLIVLDEIGRGTATYDGLALAWAVVEHIHRHIRAKTLFATHYHELTELAEQFEGVRNLHVSVKESGRSDSVPAPRRAGRGRPQLRHRSRTPRRAADERDRARPPDSGAARIASTVTEELAPQHRALADPAFRARQPPDRRSHPRAESRRISAPSRRSSFSPIYRRS